MMVGDDGSWALLDTNNETLVSSPAPQNHDGGIAMFVPFAQGPGQPCLGNGVFRPPFYRSARFLAFAVSPHEFDPREPAEQYIQLPEPTR